MQSETQDTFIDKAYDSLVITFGVAIVPWFWASGAITESRIQDLSFLSSMLLFTGSVASIGYGLKRLNARLSQNKQ